MILSGIKVRDSVFSELRDEFSILVNKPHLAIIQIGENLASDVYINQKKKMGESLGVKVSIVKLSEDLDEEEVLGVLNQYNEDNDVCGIIVQLPIPSKFNTRKILDFIKPDKDIDGLSSVQAGFLLTKNPKVYIPATAKGILSMLEYYKINLESKNIVVIGRSNLVGLPTTISLLNKNSTVTICHSYTKNLKDITKKADILIVSCGKPKFVNENFISEGQTVIDVGIHRIDVGICGDVDFENVSEKVANISPVPGGVGPLTVISLFQNLLLACKFRA